MNRSLALVFMALAFLSGCGIVEPMTKSESKLSRLSLGMTPPEVQQSLGTADRVRGSVASSDGHTLAVHEYEIYGKYRPIWNALLCPLTLTLSCWFPGGRTTSDAYWLQYVDGRLDKWGHAGDWQPSISADVTVRQSGNSTGLAAVGHPAAAVPASAALAPRD